MDRTGSGVIVSVQMLPKVIYGPIRSCFSTASGCISIFPGCFSVDLLDRAGSFRDRATLEDSNRSCEKREDYLAKS